MAPKRTLAEELAELATPRPAPGEFFALDSACFAHPESPCRLSAVSRCICSAEADFEADELAEAPTLEDGSLALEQEQQPSRSAEEPVALATSARHCAAFQDNNGSAMLL